MKNIKRFFYNLDPLHLMISMFAGLIFSLPLTGFIYGLFACSDCGSGIGGLLGRLWIGIVHGFLTVITFGKPWDNEGGGSSVNLQPFVILVFIGITYLTYRKMQNSHTNQQRN